MAIAAVRVQVPLRVQFDLIAEVAQLVEHNLAKVRVAGSSPVFRSLPAVDDYLAYCEEEGIEPHKSYSGSLNVRISPEIHNKIAMLAKQAGISINAFIKEALEKQVASSF